MNIFTEFINRALDNESELSIKKEGERISFSLKTRVLNPVKGKTEIGDALYWERPIEDLEWHNLKDFFDRHERRIMVEKNDKIMSEIITTTEKIDEVIKFGIITAFRYCILNRLDFSIGVEEDEESVATELYDEMWIDEKNNSRVKNKFTEIFNPKGL
ncbi:MAG: hypothetical protein KBA90_13855 [Chitinophagaceae bacterium]|nr:hypothetical protein [Chitinophagaceae bacterium]MBP7109638.1 hypothetical protein [Chitinophagaceae bacterium]